MTNIKALASLCNAIASSFYPDRAVLELALFNDGINPDGEATAKDARIFRAAVTLVNGYIESSRTENGVSVSVREDAIKQSLAYWCNYYGLDAEEELGDYIRTIEDGSKFW